MMGNYMLSPQRLADMRDDERVLLSYVFVAQGRAQDETYGYVLPYILQRIAVEDFAGADNAQVYRAMRALYDAGQEITLSAVAQMVGRDAATPASRGQAMGLVTTIYAQGTPTVTGAEQAVKQVKRNSLERQALWAMADAADPLATGKADDGAVEELADRLLALIAASRAANDAEQEARNVAIGVADRLGAEWQMDAAQVQAHSFLWPIAGLNKLTHGMRRGSLWVIAGLPGGGKTAFALQVAAALAGAGGKHVCYITSEVPPHDMYCRVLASAARVPFNTLINQLGAGKFSDQQYNDVLKATAQIADDNRLQCYRANTVDDIAGVMRTAIAHRKLDVLVIDHLSLLRPSRQQDKARYQGTRADMYADMVETMKSWALQHNIVVILLTQVNRVKDYRGDDGKSITLDSLYGTSATGMFADGVLALNMIPDSDNGHGQQCRMDVVKCRNGLLGKVWLRFSGAYQTFYEDKGANILPQAQVLPPKQAKTVQDLFDGGKRKE